MPFVKLDTGIIRSTLWSDKEASDVFIAALLMAEPREFLEPQAQIRVDSLERTGWAAPPGWYGFVPAAGIGILSVARIDRDAGIEALRRLGEPDKESRSRDFDGRRLIRIDGGYLVLNYIRYRERDYTAADRARRWRERRKAKSNAVSDRPIHRNVTQAEAEAEAEAENVTTDLPATAVASKPVREVFEHWRVAMGHPTAVLTPKRERLVRARLKEGYTPEQLRAAIDGCRASEFHRGKNETATVYDDLALICRDGEHVEQFLKLRPRARAQNSGPKPGTPEWNEAAAKNRSGL